MRKWILAMLVAVVQLGCEYDHTAIIVPDAGLPICAPPPGIGSFTVTLIAFGSQAPTGGELLVPGVDVDGLASNGEDPLGCFHPDFTWPETSRAFDVDNQLGPIAAALGSPELRSGQTINDSYRAALARGALTGSIDLGADTAGCGTITLTLDGVAHATVVEEQTESGLTARITDPLVVPMFDVLRTFALPLNRARIFVRLDGPNIDAALGGGVALAAATAVAVDLFGPDPGYLELADRLLTMNADLADSSGACQEISSGWRLSAEPR